MKGKYQFLYHPLEISEFSFENRVFYEYDSKTEKNLTDIVDQKMTIEGISNDFNQMKESQMKKLLQLYVEECLKAKDEGYQVCIIDGSYGSFLGTSISLCKNSRQDRWGGSLENRMRLPLFILHNLKKNVGNSILLEFRMSGAEYVPLGYDVEEGIKIAKLLDGKVDILHISAGVDLLKNSSMLKMPGILHGSNIRLTAEIKKHICTMVATGAGLNDLALMNDIIAEGKADILYV